MGYAVGLIGDDFAYHGGMVSRNDANGVPVGMGANIRGLMHGIRHLETGRVSHDSRVQELHWCDEHRVDPQLHETGDGLVVAHFA